VPTRSRIVWLDLILVTLAAKTVLTGLLRTDRWDRHVAMARLRYACASHGKEQQHNKMQINLLSMSLTMNTMGPLLHSITRPMPSVKNSIFKN